ncbi:type II toxin-antitoxin system RelE/ParE family toxin [Mucilaginibacter glaciei]|uniref:Type II toxin-antitoxin system RelE/ParE family toxin n=1 Tax=Mucilaginibacter glaciei TaxID=2772109 RepID=A0A926NRY7_9SPHI|nr:type II toxin-antitoxin system RelE/ParE family toxin [Mucilaginibacter glaciei]MBD1393917.1 type II toxin-antitoxin system RelE/ParE family toxin [Mucilaginibacter glaciei]
MENVIFSVKAEKELLASWEWYEEQQAELGDRFIREVQRKISFVIRNPLHYPLKGRHREAKIEIFPFIITYAVQANDLFIKITSVFHTSRHPEQK